MPGYKCTNCNKSFNKRINYERHINKKVPCNQQEYYICNKCGKEFYRLCNYDQHLSRKTPCNKNYVNIKLNNENISLQLELEKERTRQEEIKMQKELEKLKLQIELKKQESDHKKEEIELQRQKNIEIEILKTKRKEKTTHIINNIETINIQNNFIQQINEKYVNSDVLCLDTNKFNQTKKDIYKRKIHRENDFNIYLFNNSKTIRDFICMFLKRIFNNEKFPTMKCLFYNKELDKFYGIFQNPETKEIRQIDYEKYIDSVFRPMLIELFKNMKQYCEEHKKNINPNDKGYDKYIDITSGRLSTLDTLENVSKDALYDGYMISKEEYDQIIIGYNEEILVC